MKARRKTVKSKKKSVSSENSKVKNATPLTYDSIKFRSKLEVYCYKELKKYNINANYEPITYTVLDSFIFENKKVQGIKYTPDFVGEDFIIECKGWMNDAFPLRWKLFKHFLVRNDFKHRLYLPRNQKDIDEMIKNILSFKDA